MVQCTQVAHAARNSNGGAEMHMQDKAPGGEAIINIIWSQGHVVTIVQPDRRDPADKFPSGGVEENEDRLMAVVRETQEETTFSIPWRMENGEIILGDDTVSVHELLSRRIPGRDGLHDQYVYLTIAKNPQDILYLHGTQLKEDDDELIEVHVLLLANVLADPRKFLRFQVHLLDLIEPKLRELGILPPA